MKKRLVQDSQHYEEFITLRDVINGKCGNFVSLIIEIEERRNYPLRWIANRLEFSEATAGELEYMISEKLLDSWIGDYRRIGNRLVVEIHFDEAVEV